MSDQELLPEQPSDQTAASPTFWTWFKENEPKGTVLIAVAAVLVNIAHIATAMIHSLDKLWFPALCHGVHFAVIALLCFYSLRIAPLTSQAHPEATAASIAFQQYFYILILCWAVLYGGLTYRSVQSLGARRALVDEACQMRASVVVDASDYSSATEDLNSLRHALELAGRYQHLCEAQRREHPSSAHAGIQANSLESALDAFKKQEHKAGLGSWEYFIVLLNVGQAVPLFFLFWLMASPYKHLASPFRRGKEIVAMLMVMAIVVLTSTVLSLGEAGSLEYLGSLFGAVAFALWVGRLSSVYLGVHQPALICLFLYAIIQLSGATFREEGDAFLIVTESMMLLKVFTVFVCAWLVRSGRLLYYFEELRLLNGFGQQGPMSALLSIHDRRREFMRSVDATGSQPAATPLARTFRPADVLPPGAALPGNAASPPQRLSVDIHRVDVHIEGGASDLQKVVEKQLARSEEVGDLHHGAPAHRADEE
jgi:FtsH-binding integral membrane protein